MTEEQLGPRGPSGQPPEPIPADEDPTLETVAEATEDEPTLETAEQAVTGESTQENAVQTVSSDSTQETLVERMVGESTQEFVARKATGWGPRLEQMTAARYERRRRIVTRFWLTAAPVLILLLVAAGLLAVYGGQGESTAGVATSTTLLAPRIEGSGVLLVEKDQLLTWVVVLQPRDSGGAVLAVPGITLLKNDGAFETLAQMHKAGGANTVKRALGEALGVSLGPAAVVDWSALQAAVKAAGAAELPGDAVAIGIVPGEAVATAVKTLVAKYVSAEDGGPWDGMGLRGDSSDFLRMVGLDQASMAANAWTVGAVTGTLVDGEGFRYLEPDVEAAKVGLAVSVAATVAAVEIRDGAGIEGAARRAGSLLESGGFALSPMTYAEGYPGVEKTQVFASAAATERAQQVRSLLGLGEIVQDDTLTADHIVVMLGKDFGGESE
jgi:hypothetical protein